MVSTGVQGLPHLRLSFVAGVTDLNCVKLGLLIAHVFEIDSRVSNIISEN